MFTDVAASDSLQGLSPSPYRVLLWHPQYFLLTGSNSYDITDIMDQCIVLQDGYTAQVPSDYTRIEIRITLRKTL